MVLLLLMAYAKKPVFTRVLGIKILLKHKINNTE